MIVKLPCYLPILLVRAVRLGPDKQLGREAFTPFPLLGVGEGREGKGKAHTAGLSRASHQLLSGPLTSQPILTVGLDSSREGVSHGYLCSYDLGSECYRSSYAFRVFPEALHV